MQHTLYTSNTLNTVYITVNSTVCTVSVQHKLAHLLNECSNYNSTVYSTVQNAVQQLLQMDELTMIESDNVDYCEYKLCAAQHARLQAIAAQCSMQIHINVKNNTVHVLHNCSNALQLQCAVCAVFNYKYAVTVQHTVLDFNCNLYTAITLS